MVCNRINIFNEGRYTPNHQDDTNPELTEIEIGHLVTLKTGNYDMDLSIKESWTTENMRVSPVWLLLREPLFSIIIGTEVPRL